MLEKDPITSKIVAEIFTRYGVGESRIQIAKDLNARGIPSPGSSWKRKTRRKSGWQSSAIRAMLFNPLYTGRQRWNVSRFVRDPDSGQYLRRARKQSEWVVNQLEEFRIVSDELFERVGKLRRTASPGDPRLKLGGHRKFMLSGLLKCGACGYRYTMADNHSYACGSVIHHLGCGNTERVRRDHLQKIILEPVTKDLLTPARVARMAKEMEADYSRLLQAQSAKSASIPKELQALDDRLTRLRARLSTGDPDMEADELQAAIATVEAKRAELMAARPETRKTARILSMLPKAAESYRKQVEAGLDGDEQAMAHAHLILRDLLGPITLTPGKKGELWASYRLNPSALVKGTGSRGRGDRI